MGKLRPREASRMLKFTEQGSDRVGIKSNQISLKAARENLPCSACRLFPRTRVGGVPSLQPPKASKPVANILGTFGLPHQKTDGTRSQWKPLGEKDLLR